MFAGKRHAVARREWLDDACHRHKHKMGTASRLLTEMEIYRDAHTLKKDQREKLYKAISYFTNNKARMRFAGNQKNHLPHRFRGNRGGL